MLSDVDAEPVKRVPREGAAVRQLEGYTPIVRAPRIRSRAYDQDRAGDF